MYLGHVIRDDMSDEMDMKSKERVYWRSNMLLRNFAFVSRRGRSNCSLATVARCIYLHCGRMIETAPRRIVFIVMIMHLDLCTAYIDAIYICLPRNTPNMLEAISIGYSLAMADEHLIVVVRFQIKQPPDLAYLGDEPQPFVPL